jgi:hypothetical protein
LPAAETICRAEKFRVSVRAFYGLSNLFLPQIVDG